MSLVITGNPGVGKHTLAKSLAKILEYEIIDINKIILDLGIYEKNQDTLDVDIKKLEKIMKNFSKKCIIVGHLAPYAVSKTNTKMIIILRKSPYKLLSIYKKRKYSKYKISENIGSEILGIIAHDSLKKFGKNKTHQIDATSKSVPKLIKDVQGLLKGRKMNDEIDWLSLVSQNNDLTEFFSY